MNRTRLAIATTLFLMLSSCSGTSSMSDPTEPLGPPMEPQTTTTSRPAATSEPTPTPAPDLGWTTTTLDFGVSHITEWRSMLVGLAVQDFEAPSSLIEEDDTGCIGFQAGRTGEVVWSADGVEWEPFPVQPHWYPGPLEPQEWSREVASGEITSRPWPFRLVSGADRLLAMSFEELTAARGKVAVDVWEPVSRTWQRIGSLESVRPNTSGVAVASGRDTTIIMAADFDGHLGVWTVTETGLVEFPNPFASLVAETPERWTDEVDGVELVATNDGFLAQLEVGSGGFVMAYSVDGAWWTQVANPAAGPVHLAASGDTVIAVNGDGIWRSANRGRTWQPVAMEHPLQLTDLAGFASGFTAWSFTVDWVFPTVWFSPDGLEWRSVLQLSDEYGWINGVSIADGVIIVSVDASPGGWVCPEIVRHEYEIHLGTMTGVPPG